MYKELTNLIEFDPFVRGMVEISKNANINRRQNLHLGIYRNDFMMCHKTKAFKQVEWNTIAASISLMSDGVRNIFEQMIITNPELYQKYKNKLVDCEKGIAGITNGLEIGHKAFVQQRSNYNESYVIVFVVTDNETNLFEICSLEHELNLHK